VHALARSRPILVVVTALAVALILAACNPLITDPVSQGGEQELSSARYSGPDAVWLEVAATGAPSHLVFVLAGVKPADLTGPTARSCAGAAGVEPCTVVTGHVLSTQRGVAGDGSAYVALITLWFEEIVRVTTVCVDPVTNELGCPDGLRVKLRTVDGYGALAGDLTPVT
jgi:hypothetical protein